MPESWEDDHQRRKKAKIPDHIHYLSKPRIALKMIMDLKMRGMGFDYLSFDALYGSSFELIKTLDREGIRFIGDVKENMQVYLKEPELLATDQPTLPLCQYLDTLDLQDDFKQIAFRDGTKQRIKAYFHQKQVWICTNKQKGTLLKLQLIIRKDPDGTVKYSFCNMHQDSLTQMAARQGQRVFVERIFEEGKNEIGMGDY